MVEYEVFEEVHLISGFAISKWANGVKLSFQLVGGSRPPLAASCLVLHLVHALANEPLAPQALRAAATSHLRCAVYNATQSHLIAVEAMTRVPPSAELIGALALHYDDLVDFIRRRFQGSQFARDVVHDVCVQVLEKPPKERIKLPLAFLRRASFNKAIDRSRADNTRNAYFELSAEVPDWHVHEVDGACALDFEQQLEALLAIIEALPTRARQIFLLHRIHDMSRQDIARELGITLNMVGKHLSRAMIAIARDWEPARQALAGR